MRQLILALSCLAMLATAGCTDTRATQVVGDDAQQVYNLSAVLPRLTPSQLAAAVVALQKLAGQIGDAIGKPIDPTQGTLPAAPKSTP